MQTISINGVDYIERELTGKPNTNMSAYTSAMLTLYASMAMFNPYQNKILKGEKPKVNIIQEFELIQQKKSKLSRSEREWVIKQFNKRFYAKTDK